MANKRKSDVSTNGIVKATAASTPAPKKTAPGGGHRYVSPETREKIAAAIKDRHDEKRRNRQESAKQNVPRETTSPQTPAALKCGDEVQGIDVAGCQVRGIIQKEYLPLGDRDRFIVNETGNTIPYICFADQLELVTDVGPDAAQDTISQEPEQTPEIEPAQISRVQLALVAPFRFQPRRKFDEVELRRLGEDIQDQGQLQPALLRPDSDWYVAPGEKDGRPGFFVRNSRCEAASPTTYLADPLFYDDEEAAAAARLLARELVAGERRGRASLLVGLSTFEAVVRDLNDAQALKASISENENREDVSPIESARSYQQYAELGATQDAIAEAYDLKSRSVVANRLRLLELPEDVIMMIDNGELTESHGKALCSMSKYPVFVSYYAQSIVANGTNTKAVEKGITMPQADFDKAIREKLMTCPWNVEYNIQEVQKRYPGTFWKVIHPNVGDRYACLDIGIHQLLEREVKEKKDAENARKLGKAMDKATGAQSLPKMMNLPHGSYVDLSYDRNKCGECTKACPCRGKALDYGGTVVPICTDPKRHNRLKMAESRVVKKARRMQCAEHLETTRARLKAGDTNAISLALYFTLSSMGKKPVAAAAKVLGLDFDAEKYFDYKTSTPEKHKILTALGSWNVTSLAAMAVMQKESYSHIEGYSHGHMDWFLSQSPMPAAGGSVVSEAAPAMDHEDQLQLPDGFEIQYVATARLQPGGDIWKSYSVETLQRGQIRSNFQHGSSRFVTVAMTVGDGGAKSAECCELIPLSDWGHEYHRGLDPEKGYRGMIVEVRSRDYVMGDRFTFERIPLAPLSWVSISMEALERAGIEVTAGAEFDGMVVEMLSEDRAVVKFYTASSYICRAFDASDLETIEPPYELSETPCHMPGCSQPSAVLGFHCAEHDPDLVPGQTN